MWSIYSQKFPKTIYNYTIDLPYPYYSHIQRYKITKKFKKQIFFNSKNYIFLINFFWKLQPIFFLKLNKIITLDNKKKQFKPELVYIAPNDRVQYSQNIFFFFFWYLNMKNRYFLPLKFSPTLFNLFYMYYNSIFKRLINYYIL